jgi:hypothetical protein
MLQITQINNPVMANPLELVVVVNARRIKRAKSYM